MKWIKTRVYFQEAHNFIIGYSDVYDTTGLTRSEVIESVQRILENRVKRYERGKLLTLHISKDKRFVNTVTFTYRIGIYGNGDLSSVAELVKGTERSGTSRPLDNVKQQHT